MKNEMFALVAYRLSAVVASCCLLAAGCSSAEPMQSNLESGESGAEEVGSQSQALHSALAACEAYEAENIGRTGGAPASGGDWKLFNAGDNINVNRMFVAGQHTFSIRARGVAGGGVKPQLRLTLNGVQIGGNITVTNTAITDGWKEFLVSYNVTTANNKLIKVELVNPGSGRTVVIDGIHLYCPTNGVVCGNQPSCGSCCHDTIEQRDYCGLSVCSNPIGVSISCDQHTDCGPGSICATKYNNNGQSVSCVPIAECVDSFQPLALCAQICKSPTKPQSACPQGETCTDMGPTMPGWKRCE